MPEMTPQTLVDSVSEVLGDNLVSITLYGPTALEEESKLPDDAEHPMLIVTERLDLDALTRLSDPIQKWRASGQPHPLVFTRERLKQSSDSFAVELLDMKEARKVLHGEDSILKLEVNRTHFQQELLSNLKNHLLAMRASFIDHCGNGDALRSELIDSLSTLRLLLRSTLRLYVPTAATSHAGVLNSLKIHIPVDPAVYDRINEMKRGDTIEQVESLYVDYLMEVEKLIDAVDSLKLKRGGGATYPPFRG